MTDLDQCAALLDTAAAEARAVQQLSVSGNDLSLGDAYRVQKIAFERRIARGEKQVGMKMGFTSRAKMVQMGVHSMIWGRLTDAMRIEEGGHLDMTRFIHPRVEPEIAFIMKRPLSGAVSPAEAMAAVEAVTPAIEVIDSRYDGFKFNLADVVADNSSSSAFVLGGWSRPDSDIGNLGMIMQFDGRPVQVGSSAAILGHPARSLAAAARIAAANEFTLETGWIVLAGGATVAEALKPGLAVRLDVEQLGIAEFQVV